MEAKKYNYFGFLLVIFAIAATPALSTESGSGDEICNGDIQQLKNCTESELVRRFYFDSSVQKCVEYTTCPLNSSSTNVFETMESCEKSCGEETPEDTICPDFPAIENGHSSKHCQHGFCYMLFSCERTHKLVGSSSLFCFQSDGQWTGSMPSCMAISVYFEGEVVPNDITVKPPEGMINLEFECRLNPQNIPDNFIITQQWILDHELDTKQYFSDEKSAYILEVAGTKSTRITCSVEASSEETPTAVVTMSTRFNVEVSTEAEPPILVHPFSNVNDDEISLICLFNGKPKPTVSWYLNGILVEPKPPHVTITDFTATNPSSTFSALTIQAPTESDYGEYTCNATNAAGKSSDNFLVPAPERSIRSISSDTLSHALCNSALQDQTAMLKGRLIRKLTQPQDQNTYHLKIDAVIHSNNFANARAGSVLSAVSGLQELPLDLRRHQPAIFTVGNENGRIVLNSFQPYSEETERDIEQKCFK